MFRKLFSVIIGLFILSISNSNAQTVAGDRFRFNTGPCYLRSGSGSPESVVVGNVCDQYLDITTGNWWRKHAGSGNTGWRIVVSVSSGTLSRLLYASSANTWADAPGLRYNATTGQFNVTNSTSGDNQIVLYLAGLVSAGVGYGINGEIYNSQAGPVIGTVLTTGSSYAGTVPYLTSIQGQVRTLHADTSVTNTYMLRAMSPILATDSDIGASYGLHIQQQDVTGVGSGYGIFQDGATDINSFAGPLQHPSYVSQLTNWQISAVGAADFRYLFTDELHAKSFIADLEQALAGGQIITKSVAVIVSMTCPAAGATATLTVEDLPGAADMQVFDVSDWIAIRTFSRAAQTLSIADCVGQVSAPDTSGSGTQAWTFTRGSGGSAGTMSTSTVIPAGTIVLDYGVSGAGYYEVNAVDGIDAVNSPYAQVVTWSTAPVAANRTVRGRYGKLTGITGTADEYGLLAGNYAVSDGAYFRASNAAFDLHGITAKWWDGATNVVIIAPNSGAPYIGVGNPAPTGCCTSAGVFLGWTTGNVAAFSAYSDANNFLTWDGTKLTWKAANTTLDASGNLTASSATLSGSVTASSGSIGGWSIGTDYLRDAAGVVGMSSAVTGGDDIRFWAGDATPGSAEFRVTEAGALVATSATITGAITANTGYIGGTSGWVISANYLKDVAGVVGLSSVVTGGDDVRFWAGDATPGSAEFRVTEAGVLTASSGTVGGWTLGASTLTGGDATLASSGNLTLGTSNDVLRASADDATYRLWIGNATAASAPFRVTKTGILYASDYFLTKKITTVTTTGNFALNNLNQDYVIIYWNGSSDSTLTGITNMVDGQEIIVANMTTTAGADLTIDHCTSGDCFRSPTENDIVLPFGGTITATYDASGGHQGIWISNIDIPLTKPGSGLYYVCINSSGALVSQSSACQ